MKYAAVDPGAYLVRAHPSRIRARSLIMTGVGVTGLVTEAVDGVRRLAAGMTVGQAPALLWAGLFIAGPMALVLWAGADPVVARLRGSIGVAVDAPGVTLDSRPLRRRTGSGHVRWENITQVRLYTLMSRDSGESPASTIFRPVIHLDLSDGTHARWVGRDGAEGYDCESLAAAVRRFAPQITVVDDGAIYDDYYGDPANPAFDPAQASRRMYERSLRYRDGAAARRGALPRSHRLGPRPPSRGGSGSYTEM